MSANEQEVAARISEKRRAEDFSSHYANNIHLEPSGWDLKFLFGQLDLNLDPTKVLVLQHSDYAALVAGKDACISSSGTYRNA